MKEMKVQEGAELQFSTVLFIVNEGLRLIELQYTGTINNG